MPLIICRRAGQKIRLTIDPSADPQAALRWLLAGGIDIEITGIQSDRVRLALRAPDE